jgi:hypothetical protein
VRWERGEGWENRCIDIQAFNTMGSCDLSTSVQITSVGKMRFGLGMAALAGGHLRLKVRTMGWSLETGSPCVCKYSSSYCYVGGPAL